MSLVRPILGYGASRWDPYRDGQINASDRVQKKAAKYANHTNDLAWETLSQARKIAHICALLEAYTGEREWNSIGNGLKGTCYRSRDDHDRKIMARKQRRDIGKYSCVHRNIKLWNQLTAETLATVNHIFLERELGK